MGEEDLSETEAVDSFIAMNEHRKRTWAQAQELKKAARKDRGFFSSRTAVRNRANASRQLRQSMRRSPNPMDGDGKPKDLRARLRKENRCFRCKKKGHWKTECPEKQHNKDGTGLPVFSGLTFLHTVGEESVWNAATWSDQCDEDAAWATGSPEIPPGHLIVDSAAGQPLVGEAACVEWEQKLSIVGLRGVRVNSKMMTPKGVGGTAHPTRTMMMPTMIDGLSGVLHYTVVKEDIPGLLPLSFQEKQGAMINLRTNNLHLPHLRAVVPMHRTQGGHRTIDVTMGLTPVTFRVPEEISQRFGLSWHQFVMGDTVESSIRSGNDQTVTKDETRDVCRGKISKSISHFAPSHNMVTIHHQDTVNRRDNFHPHLTDNDFPQDDQGCDNLSSSSHDTGSFSLSNTISSIDLTNWGPDVRRHNQSGQSMGSTDTNAVVTTRRGLARASQVWQDDKHDRTFNVRTPQKPGGKTERKVSNDSRRRSAITGRRRRFYARKPWRRRKWPEGWRNRRTELLDPLKDDLGHEPDFPLSNR